MSLFCVLAFCLSASAQIHILGKDSRDAFYSTGAFWSQNNNASNLIQGLNANAGTNKFINGLLPDLVSGKTLSGDIYGTNVFSILVYDGGSSSTRRYDFALTNNVGSTNQVSRITATETLQNKTLASSTKWDGSGIPKANSSSTAVSFITPLSGTNRILIQKESSFGTPTNYVEFIDGVMTSGSTTLRLASAEWVTNYVGSAVLAVFTGTATATASNTTNETSIRPGSGSGSATLAASYLAAGKTIRVKASGYYGSKASSAGTVTIKVKLGSVELATTGAKTLTDNLTNEAWSLEFTTTCYTAGASGTVFSQGGFEHNIGTSVLQKWAMVKTATTTVDTTASAALDVTVAFGTADSANTITCSNFSIESLKP